MVIIALCNHKGGTGKTTTALNLAAALGLSGFRTLAIDLDPQAYLTSMLGIAEPGPDASACAFFRHDIDPSDIPCVEYPGFDVIPGSAGLTRLMRKLTNATDVFWLKEALQARKGYDVAILDTAAAVTVYSLNALVAARFVIIPVIPEDQPVLGAEQTHQTVSLVSGKLNPKMHTPFFLLTQVDARKRAHNRLRAYLRATYGENVLRPIIRTSAALSASSRDGLTVFRRDPYSRGARDYANLTDEVVRIVGLQPDEA